MSQDGIKILLASIFSKTRGPIWGTSQKMVTDNLLFYSFPTFDHRPHGPKSTRHKKTYISTWESYLSEGNFSPIWRNNIGHILLKTMDDSPVWFIMIPNIISSNPIPHMVVPFILVPLHWKEQCQEREMKRGQTATKKIQAQRKALNWILPQISSYILWLQSTRVVEHDSKSIKISTTW